jgi:hypothetical protein
MERHSGLFNPPPRQRGEIWRAVSRELAHLHLRVRECPDPEAEAPGALGGFPEARIAWDRLLDIMDDLRDSPARSLEVEALQQFIHARMG